MIEHLLPNYGETNLWTTKMGGMILLDGRIYGSGDANKEWYCIDWETGEELYSSKMLKVGNIIYADGLLYCYGTGGKVGIVDPTTNDYNLISSFKVPLWRKVSLVTPRNS